MIVARCFLGGMEDAGVLDDSDAEVLAAVTAEHAEIAPRRASLASSAGRAQWRNA